MKIDLGAARSEAMVLVAALEVAQRQQDYGSLVDWDLLKSQWQRLNTELWPLIRRELGTGRPSNHSI